MALIARGQITINIAEKGDDGSAVRYVVWGIAPPPMLSSLIASNYAVGNVKSFGNVRNIDSFKVGDIAVGSFALIDRTNGSAQVHITVAAISGTTLTGTVSAVIIPDQGTDGNPGTPGASTVPVYTLSDANAPEVPSDAVAELPEGWSLERPDPYVTGSEVAVTTTAGYAAWEYYAATGNISYSVTNSYSNLSSLYKAIIILTISTQVEFELVVKNINSYGDTSSAKFYVQPINSSPSTTVAPTGEITLTPYDKAVITVPTGVNTLVIKSQVSVNGVGMLQLSGMVSQIKKTIWCSMTEYNGTTYLFGEPYMPDGVDGDSILGDAISKGAFKSDGGLSLNNIFGVTDVHSGEAEAEDLRGVMSGKKNDGIFLTAHDEDAYNRAYDFIQGEELLPPSFLVDDKGNNYATSYASGAYSASTSLCYTSSFGTIVCSSERDKLSVQTGEAMPNLSESSWRSTTTKNPILSPITRVLNGTSDNATVSLTTPSVTALVPSMLNFSIWMQGDLRTYTVQRYYNNSWFNIYTGYLQVRPSGFFAAVAFPVMDGIYRVVIEARSYGLAGSLVPIVKLAATGYGISATPMSGMFMYGDGYMSVFVNSTYGRSAYGLRGGEILDYKG